MYNILRKNLGFELIVKCCLKLWHKTMIESACNDARMFCLPVVDCRPITCF